MQLLDQLVHDGTTLGPAKDCDTDSNRGSCENADSGQERGDIFHVEFPTDAPECGKDLLLDMRTGCALQLARYVSRTIGK